MLHHRALVDAGALVGTGEFDELIGILGSVGIAAHDDAIGGNRRHGAGFLGQDADAGVDAGLVFHAGADDGGIGFQQRHGLALHVGAHQGTVGVVVFQEGDHGRRDGHDHLRGDVHVVDLFPLDFQEFAAVTGVDAGAGEPALLVQRLVGLGDDEIVLHVGGHIHHFVGDHAGDLVHPAEGRFDEAVFIDAGEGGQV